MADVPNDLLEQIKELERLFTVDQAKLKKITEKFVKELEKGTADSPIRTSRINSTSDRSQC
jgi:hexokinase